MAEKDSTMMHINLDDIESMEKRKRAHLINSLSGFKSANLLGTKSRDGATNLSIISSAFHLGADPALMGFIIRPDVSPRHSLDNMRETKFLTINHINEDIYEKAHQTSARYPKDFSEFDSCGLTEQYLDSFHAPFVAEANIKVALEVIREVKIEENGVQLVIAKITSIYHTSEIAPIDGPLDIEKAGTIAVSGLDTYHSTQKVARLSYAKIDKPLKKI